MVIARFRIFSGKRFRLWNKYTSKTKAELAKGHLVRKGKQVRIIKMKRKGVGITDYVVYYRPYER